MRKTVGIALSLLAFLLVFTTLVNAESIQSITGCQELTVSNTEYKLENDIILNEYEVTPDSICFPITSDDVTLDLNGYKITGTNLVVAVDIIGKNSITIKNGIIENFEEGIYSVDSTNIVVDNIEFIDNDLGKADVEMINSSNSVIKNSKFNSESIHGIFIEFGSNNTIQDSIIENSWSGVSLVETTNNIIINTVVQNNAGRNIYVDVVTEEHCNNTLTNVIGNDGKPVLHYNSKVEIENMEVSEAIFCNADLSSVKNITIADGGGSNGIFIIKTDGAYFSNLNVNNTGEGIFIRESNLNLIENSSSSNNINEGVQIEKNSNFNIISGGSFENNLYSNIAIRDSNANIITNNFIGKSQRDVSIFLGDDATNNAVYNNEIVGEVEIGGTQNHLNTNSIVLTTNIIGGQYVGGNYWTNENGTGFSDTCADTNRDGICDSSYQIDSNNIDYFPLTYLSPDIIPPIITLLSPENSYVKKTSSSSYNVGFDYIVEDESGISSCILIVNNQLKGTKNNVVKFLEDSFLVEFDRDDYNWYVQCVDSEGNVGYSETRSFEIKKKSSSSSSSSSSNNIKVVEFTQLSEDSDVQTSIENTNYASKDNEVIVLKPAKQEEGFFESIIKWFFGLFR